MRDTTALLVPVIPVVVRPRLTFVPMGDGAAWVISRRVENGRYRWNARLRFDGERRSTRAEDWADWRSRRGCETDGDTE